MWCSRPLLHPATGLPHTYISGHLSCSSVASALVFLPATTLIYLVSLTPTHDITLCLPSILFSLCSLLPTFLLPSSSITSSTYPTITLGNTTYLSLSSSLQHVPVYLQQPILKLVHNVHATVRNSNSLVDRSVD